MLVLTEEEVAVFIDQRYRLEWCNSVCVLVMTVLDADAVLVRSDEMDTEWVKMEGFSNDYFSLDIEASLPMKMSFLTISTEIRVIYLLCLRAILPNFCSLQSFELAFFFFCRISNLSKKYMGCYLQKFTKSYDSLKQELCFFFLIAI